MIPNAVLSGLRALLERLFQRYPAARAFYRKFKEPVVRWRERRLPNYLTIDGYRLHIGYDDLGMRRNYRDPSYFADFRTIIHEYVAPGDTVFDVGSHVGMTTAMLAKRVGEDGSVVSFEPTPDNRETQKQNLRDNDIHNATVYPYALSNEIGTATFYINREHSGLNSLNATNASLSPKGTSGEIEIDTITLDEFILRHPGSPRFIKLDTQGAELNIFEGARGFLGTDESAGVVIYLEFWPLAIENLTGRNPVEFLQLVQTFGLDIVWTEDGLENAYSFPLSKDDCARFVSEVADLPRKYTNILLRKSVTAT